MFATLHDRGSFAKYPQLASRHVAGEDLSQRLGDLSPAYFWLNVLVVRAGTSSAALQIGQIVAVSLAALLCAYAAFQWCGPIAAWVAALAVLGSRGAMVNATELEPETLMLLAIATALALLGSRLNVARAAAAGLALGVAIVTRPSALLAFAGAAIFLLLRAERRLVLWLAAAAALPVVAVLAVNARLTHSVEIMDPGSVFFEGMNPYATGLAGVQPRIVNDLETTTPEPDSLHLMYRAVAARATKRPPTREVANHYWSAKARAFASAHPAAAIRLTLRKTHLAFSAYEPWDLVSSWRKERELASHLWLPFSIVTALALLGVLLLPSASTRLPLLFVLAGAATLVLFYVTARQRNALIAPTAVLAGCGVAALAEMWTTTPPRKRFVAIAVAVATAMLLTPSTSVTRADEWGWQSGELATRFTMDARTVSNPDIRLQSMANAFVARPDLFTTLPAAAVSNAATQALQSSDSLDLWFNAAVAFSAVGEWQRSLTVIESLQKVEYQPVQENRLPSSLSYFEARARLHLGDRAGAIEAIRRAEEEQPGGAEILALHRAIEPQRGAELDRELLALHDPFTARYATAQADVDAGEVDEARTTLRSLRAQFPQWHRPAILLEALPAPALPVQSSAPR